MGASPEPIPAHLYLVLRGTRLVLAQSVPAIGGGGARGHGVLDVGRFRKSAHYAADPDVRGWPLPLLHGVPWRAGDAQAAPPLPDLVLPDDLGRRRGGRRGGGADRAAILQQLL